MTQIYGYAYDASNDRHFMVLELCSEGELLHYLKTQNTAMPQKLDLLAGIVWGMIHLHSSRIMYGE